jgi:hypothetical protein
MAKAEQPGDPNMALARHFAASLGTAPPLPRSLQSVERRAELVHRIDAPLVERLELFAVVGGIATRVRDILRVTPELGDHRARIFSGSEQTDQPLAHRTEFWRRTVSAK